MGPGTVLGVGGVVEGRWAGETPLFFSFFRALPIDKAILLG